MSTPAESAHRSIEQLEARAAAAEAESARLRRQLDSRPPFTPDEVVELVYHIRNALCSPQPLGTRDIVVALPNLDRISWRSGERVPPSAAYPPYRQVRVSW